MELSIIIIGKNSSSTLNRVFHSIKREIDRHFILAETIYVDSCSKDNSVEIAKSHGAKVIEVLKGFTSAALGRHLGMKYAKGNYILLMDGDMELEVGALSTLLNTIEDHAVLIPERREVIYQNGKIKTEIPNFKNNVDGPLKSHCFKKGSNSIGGFMLIHSDSLDNISFNKNLRDEEEADFVVHLPQKSSVQFSTQPGFVHHNSKELPVKFMNLLSPTGNLGYLQGLFQSIRNGKFKIWLRVQCKYALLILCSILFWIFLFSAQFEFAGLTLLLAIAIPGFGFLGTWANMMVFPYKLMMAIFDSMVPKNSTVRYPDNSVVDL